MSATKDGVPRAYVYVSSPCRRVGINALGDKNTNDGAFNMDDMKNALNDLGGDGVNGVPIMPNRS
jgi:hypothetical protein